MFAYSPQAAICSFVGLRPGGAVMPKSDPKEIEFHSDAMERFERAVKAVAKSPPQHRVAKKKKAVNKSKAKKKPGK
jgi:hypothetical protein